MLHSKDTGQVSKGERGLRSEGSLPPLCAVGPVLSQGKVQEHMMVLSCRCSSKDLRPGVLGEDRQTSPSPAEEDTFPFRLVPCQGLRSRPWPVWLEQPGVCSVRYRRRDSSSHRAAI